MKKKMVSADEILKLDLQSIYPVGEIMRVLNLDANAFSQLENEGLKTKWLFNQQWVKASDLWEMMNPKRAALTDTDSHLTETAPPLDKEGKAALLTVSEVAKELRCCESTVWKLREKGQLRVIKLNSLVRFPREEIDRFTQGKGRKIQ